tara:strand:+ start:545 stop:2272 length:1728 start_codon:yes stop_codon:yes gene_type:complete
VQDQNSADFQDWFDGADIFFRAKDKHRFQTSLDAIGQGKRGLAVIGGNDGVLDHYSRMLVTHLRDMQNFQVEVFLPNDTDSLLNRFNHILAKMTMEEARKPADASALVHLLVVNDAKSVKQDQWNLLVRLMTDFPGTNVRLVMFIDKTGWPGFEKLLTMFGRQLYRWVVDTPSVDEAIQLMYAAREHGYENDTQLLLEQVGLGDVVAPDVSEIMPGDIDILSEDTLMQDIGGSLVFPDEPLNFDDDKFENDSERTSHDTKVLMSSKFKEVAFGVMIVLLSLGVTLFVLHRFNPTESVFYRDLIWSSFQEWGESLNMPLSGRTESLKDDSSVIKLVSDKKKSDDIKHEDFELRVLQSEGSKTTEATENKLVVRSTSNVSDGSLENAGALEMSENLEDPAENNAEQIILQSGSAVVKKEQIEALLEAVANEYDTDTNRDYLLSNVRGLDQNTISEILVTEEEENRLEDEIVTVISAPPRLSISAAASKVRNSKASDFFVQYIVFTSEAQASSFIDDYRGLADALIVPISLRGKPAYAVVEGPFGSLSGARGSVRAEQLPGDYWFRSASQLKGALRGG